MPRLTNAWYFSATPDVALVNQDGKDFLTVSLGSGWRTHPLDTAVNDRFYSIRDYAVYSPSRDSSDNITYPAFAEVDLTDVSDYTTGVDPIVTNGWYIDMESAGEKDPVTIEPRTRTYWVEK